jgi:hypothetical protein
VGIDHPGHDDLAPGIHHLPGLGQQGIIQDPYDPTILNGNTGLKGAIRAYDATTSDDHVDCWRVDAAPPCVGAAWMSR